MIETKEDWWKALNDNWDELYDLMWAYLPMNELVNEHGNFVSVVTAAEKLDIKLHLYIRKLKETQDRHIARYLFTVWDMLPDSPSIHSINTFPVLCELLAEEYVLYVEARNAKMVNRHS